MKLKKNRILLVASVILLFFFVLLVYSQPFTQVVLKYCVYFRIFTAGGVEKIQKETDYILSHLPAQEKHVYFHFIKNDIYPASAILSVSENAYAVYEYEHLPKHVSLALGGHFFLHYVYVFSSSEPKSRILNSGTPLIQIKGKVYLLGG